MPEEIQAELLRLQTEEGWSDQRLSILLKDRWGIELSRPSVNRLMNELRAGAGKPVGVAPVEVGEIAEPPLGDEDQLAAVQRDLFRAARMAHKGRDFNAQVKAASALIGLIFKKREAESPGADKGHYVNWTPRAAQGRRRHPGR